MEQGPFHQTGLGCVQDAGPFHQTMLMCVQGAGTFPSDHVDVLTCVQGAERGLPAAAGDCGLGAGGARDAGLHGGEGLLCAVPA